MQDLIKQKRCTKCGEVKDVGEFSKDKSRYNGYRSHCRKCCKIYREINKERIRKRDKEYCQKNKDKIRKRNKKWWQENKKKSKEYNKKYWENNKRKICKKSRKYYEKNAENLKKLSREYYWENKKKIKKRTIKYRRHLPDAYVKLLIRNQLNVDNNEISYELIEIKRLQIRLIRGIKRCQKIN